MGNLSAVGDSGKKQIPWKIFCRDSCRDERQWALAQRGIKAVGLGSDTLDPLAGGSNNHGGVLIEPEFKMGTAMIEARQKVRRLLTPGWRWI